MHCEVKKGRPIIQLCIYIIVQRFIAKYFKYGGHLEELHVTQISKYRGLTHVRETGQINASLSLPYMFLFIIQCYQP